MCVFVLKLELARGEGGKRVLHSVGESGRKEHPVSRVQFF